MGHAERLREIAPLRVRWPIEPIRHGPGRVERCREKADEWHNGKDHEEYEDPPAGGGPPLGVNTAKVAPCGSASTAKRPTFGMSVAALHSRAPSPCAWLQVASTFGVPI